MDEVGSATISVRAQQADHHTNQTSLGLPIEITESREMLQIFIDSVPDEDWLFGGTFSLTSAAQQPMEAISDPSSNLRKIPCVYPASQCQHAHAPLRTRRVHMMP